MYLNILGQQQLTENDHQEITDVLNQADYQSNDVDYLQCLMIKYYRSIFGRREYSLRNIMMVGRYYTRRV